MDKIKTLQKEIQSLEEKRKEANHFLKKVNTLQNDIYGYIADAYENFYNRKRNKEFVLYERFPNMDALQIYVSRRGSFPLQQDGELNVKELAEIVKHLYQFRADQEFEILTVGATELKGMPVYGGQTFSNVAHLYFLVGNAFTLAPFKEFNGKYINSDKVNTKIDLYAKGKNLLCIEADKNSKNTLGIECLTHRFWDKEGLINYYNEGYSEYMTLPLSSEKQVFSSYLSSHLNYAGGYNIKGIKDVFDFTIHPFDSYIAKVLISIIIYKRNNGIVELTNEDYHHIFDVLFGEKVEIKEEAERDIPKQLLYVQSEKSGR